VTQKDGLAASEGTLGRVRMEHDAERAQAEVMWQDYLDRMHSLSAS
jgi:hypothetical protein